MSTGIKIFYKDGSLDWIDPLVSQTEDDEFMVIDNGYSQYSIPKDRVLKTELYVVEEA